MQYNDSFSQNISMGDGRTGQNQTHLIHRVLGHGQGLGHRAKENTNQRILELRRGIQMLLTSLYQESLGRKKKTLDFIGSAM